MQYPIRLMSRHYRNRNGQIPYGKNVIDVIEENDDTFNISQRLFCDF